MTTMTRVRPLSALLTALVVLAVGTAAFAARPAIMLSQQEIDGVRERAADLAEASREARQPLPEGQVRVLKAVVMKVTGRAQWRIDDESPWRNAKVDDLLEAGARIRTGRNSSLALRVGQNATVLVDRSSRIALPEIVQAGATLRTAIELRRGRADVKVDRVGLTNDFSVVTPSATLAVRGTGYGVRYGAFEGTEVVASRQNEMFAIELTYFLSRLSYALSGGALSNDLAQNPVLAELFQTLGPPQIVSALVESDATVDELMAALGGTPLGAQRTIDLLNQATEELETIIDEIDDELGGGDEQLFLVVPEIDGFTQADVADFICTNLFSIFLTYDDLLSGVGSPSPGAPTFPGLNGLQNQIDAQVCVNGQEGDGFLDQDLIEILELVAAFCESSFDTVPEQQHCIDDFATSVLEEFVGGQ